MKPAILLDTNIVLDFFLDRKPYADDAATILKMAVQDQLKAAVTPLTISDSYYILRKVASHKRVVDKLIKLTQMTAVTRMSSHTVELALRSDFTDLEDALQNFSAVYNEKIDVIITRNVKDFKKSSAAVMTPDLFLKSLRSLDQQ